ncbi:transglycosylase domain-containing protein [Proteiniclasticum sp. SCR006]|uniref:Penicillin-binding protein 1A n=1 Tax=Proteiniclasticum aestuarii TaxID=2817862 RepID=A0A939KFZ1_9CLOT|nr:transglycosylase domain-containing protein [Proteiniclasticum aestuarii]MBO1263804.1 transglycosylase domain-containing protein [Proteiniclasticum aestuarii]
MIALIIATMVGSLYVAKIVLEIAEEAPEVNVSRFLSLNEPSIVLDNEGNQMDLIHTDEVRFPLALEDMGQNIIDAFISIEDERFEKHKGVDYRRTIGVTIRDIVGQVTGNRDMQGGSTLTQQMIKNTFLSREQKYERKIKEIFMALHAEKMLTKEQILETYLNSVFLGGRANGVEAAARQYFNKSANELNVVEAAYIAGTTQSPSNYYAFSQSSMANPSKYLNRTKLVLNAMLKNEKITEAEHELYTRSLDESGIQFSQTSIVSDKYNYEYFTRPVLDQVEDDLKREKGYTDEEIADLFAYGGLVIHSTMDRDAQEYAQSVLADYDNIKATYIDPLAEKNRVTGEYEAKRKEVEAAFAATDYRTGQVKVLIGGRDDSTSATANRSYYSPTFPLSSLRPIGSTTKPITIYGPALETGAITLGTPALDKQISKRTEADMFRELDAPSTRSEWPNNVNFRYTGYTSVRKSIVNSYNTVSIRTYYALGNDRVDIVRNFGEKYGLIFADRSNVGAVGYAMGGNYEYDKDGGNPLIMAGAYGMFGNSGIFTENILYTKVTDSEGNIILENIPKSEQILSAQNAYLLYDVMKDIVRNNVPGTKLTSMPIAGKTGTATNDDNEQTDLWFAGLSPYYSAAIWFGSDRPLQILNGDSNRGASSYVTQYAFGKIMAYLNEGHEVRDISRPQGLTTASFCMESGGIPNEQCYIDGTVSSDLFVTGTQPRTVCDVHTYEPPVIEPIPEEPEEPAIPTPPGNNGNGNGNNGNDD